MQLENVQYLPHLLTNKRIAALFMLSVGLPYAWKRFFRYLSSSRWVSTTTADDDADSNAAEARRTRLLSIMKRIETVVVLSQFANFMAFLRKGTYRSLPERILGMKLVLLSPPSRFMIAIGLTGCHECRKTSRLRTRHEPSTLST